MGDLLAEKAIADRQVPGAGLKDGNDLDAREGMALGASLRDGLSNVGVAAVMPSIPRRRRHPLFARAGMGCFCRSSCASTCRNDSRSSPASRKLLAGPLGLTLDEAAERAVIPVENLRRDIGIPSGARPGGHEEQLRPFAEKASLKRILRVNRER